MTVAQITQWQVNPGRQQDFMAAVAQAKGIHESHGAKMRDFQNTLAGPATLSVGYVMEFADQVAHANFTAALATDEAWQQFVATALRAPDPSATMLSNSLANEITPS